MIYSLEIVTLDKSHYIDMGQSNSLDSYKMDSLYKNISQFEKQNISKGLEKAVLFS